MATYVCSDLHGQYEKYIKLLRAINFSEADTLIVAGDVVDRGEHGLEIIEHIRKNKNIILLLGNHEQMIVDYFLGDMDFRLWFENGGVETYIKLEEKGGMYVSNLINYFKKLPIYYVYGKFVIVHGGLTIFKKNMSLKEILEFNDADSIVWNRQFIYSDDLIDGHTIICGHTPTLSINGRAEILHLNGKIAIDCGCCFEGGKLGCLRLDDMKEFYI